jgi:hypothetical protein
MNIVSNNIQASWILLWHETNEKFDFMLQNDFDLVHLVGKMFSVWGKIGISPLIVLSWAQKIAQLSFLMP